MDENVSVTPTQPNPNQANSSNTPSDKKALLFLVAGVVILFAAVAGVFVSTYPSSSSTSETSKPAKSTAITGRQGLDQAASQLDQSNLDFLSNGIDQNSVDASSF